jgi:hypothetical protein
MTDEMLLAVPDWKDLCDTELVRAVTLAKKRGRQTAELISAQSAETGNPFLREKMGNFDLYITHCVRVVPDSEDLVAAWGEKNAIEACDDPRLAWFCVIYQRTRWRMIGKGTPPKTPVLTLQKIRDRQFENLGAAQFRISMQVAAIHQLGGDVHEQPHRQELHRLQGEFMVQLDYAMLAVMTLNVATEEWIGGEPR